MEKTEGRASHKVMIENSRMRVTEWRFRNRGDDTGWHRHEHDYLVIPLFDGVLEIDQGNNITSRVELKNGQPYAREFGVEHNVMSANDFECCFLEV